MTGLIRPTIKTAYSKGLDELKELLTILNTQLEGKDYLVGNKISLADIHIASYVYYPVSLALNTAFRNKILNFMKWFNRLSETQEFINVYGNLKLLTQPLTPPEKFA